MHTRCNPCIHLLRASSDCQNGCVDAGAASGISSSSESRSYFMRRLADGKSVSAHDLIKLSSSHSHAREPTLISSPQPWRAYWPVGWPTWSCLAAVLGVLEPSSSSQSRLGSVRVKNTPVMATHLLGLAAIGSEPLRLSQQVGGDGSRSL